MTYEEEIIKMQKEHIDDLRMIIKELQKQNAMLYAELIAQNAGAVEREFTRRDGYMKIKEQQEYGRD